MREEGTSRGKYRGKYFPLPFSKGKPIYPENGERNPKRLAGWSGWRSSVVRKTRA